jgi:predicted nucleotidyltransferase
MYWELEKFLRLALKANPNVLECLYSPVVEVATPLACELIEMRQAFLSRHVHRTYRAYVHSQFERLEAQLRERGRIRWKHAMHLIRLLLSGTTVLREGFVPVRLDRYREELLAIRRGEVAWAEVERWSAALARELDAALVGTRLPEAPDLARVDGFLIRARRLAAAPEYGQ